MMIFLRFLAVCICLSVLSRHGGAQAASETERIAVIEALKRAAIALPEDKRGRAEAAISRFEQGDEGDATDYGWDRAEPILKQSGVDGLIQQATRPGGPLRYARADALFAAGIRLRDEDAVGARRLNATLVTLAERADEFERPIYAHAAAELAMIRCDRAMFVHARGHLQAPDSLRYLFWQGRLDGSIQDLIPLIDEAVSDDDTRDIRQILDGYRPIAAHGYCPSDRRQ